MKQVNIHGPDDVRVDDAKDFSVGSKDVVVRVANCGICGTDLRYIRMGGMSRPMALGHELSGVVEEIGGEVTGISVGDNVVLNPTAEGNMVGNGGPEGGFAHRLLVRNAAAGTSLFAVPDGLPMHLAALAEPLGVGLNAVNQSDPVPGDKFAVFGAGPIGLAAVASLVDKGIDNVVAIDFSTRRLAIAKELGAYETIDAGEEKVWDRLKALHGTAPLMGAPMAGTDAFIEATGAGSVITDVLQNAKPRARLTVVALHEKPVSVSFLWVMMKQLTIRGAMEYPEDYSETLALLSRRDLSPMITHRFGLEQFSEAYEVARDPTACGKIMIDIEN